MATPHEELLIQRLMNAAHSGDLRRMKECGERLDHGEGLLKTYIRARGHMGVPALHYSAGGGKTHICKYLIEVVGMDVDMQDPQGDTVLNHATRGNNHQTVAYLIRKGANVNLANHKGLAPLHVAALEGRKESMRLLISNGADIEALSHGGTPLHCAASLAKKEVLKILLDNNANPNAGSHDMYTPLVATIYAGSNDCLNLLLKAGADPNFAPHGVSPLENAAYEGDNEAIKCLLNAGANANATNLQGLTPLEITALCLNHEGAMILLPKTYPIPTIPDWTLSGIIKSVNSVEAIIQTNLKRKVNFMESMSKGAEAFKKKDYVDAIFWYSRAKICEPREATSLSNRSLCWACLNEGYRALSDAKDCIKLKPDWSKAHYRKGVACEILKDFVGAAKAYAFALKLEPSNEEIQKALRNVKVQSPEPFRGVVEDEYGFSGVD